MLQVNITSCGHQGLFVVFDTTISNNYYKTLVSFYFFSNVKHTTAFLLFLIAKIQKKNALFFSFLMKSSMLHEKEMQAVLKYYLYILVKLLCT